MYTFYTLNFDPEFLLSKWLTQGQHREEIEKSCYKEIISLNQNLNICRLNLYFKRCVVLLQGKNNRHSYKIDLKHLQNYSISHCWNILLPHQALPSYCSHTLRQAMWDPSLSPISSDLTQASAASAPCWEREECCQPGRACWQLFHVPSSPPPENGLKKTGASHCQRRGTSSKKRAQTVRRNKYQQPTALALLSVSLGNRLSPGVALFLLLPKSCSEVLSSALSPAYVSRKNTVKRYLS